MYKRLTNYLRRPKKEYTNIVDASYVTYTLVGLAGHGVLIRKCTNGKVTARFSLYGFVSYAIWFISYLYCFYAAFVENQTILRTLYNTKLKNYGDFYEITASTVYFILVMSKTPLLSGSVRYYQALIDIDNAIEDIGIKVDYQAHSNVSLGLALAEIVAATVRSVTIFGTLQKFTDSIPHERIFQVVITDALALVMTSFYCLYINILKIRYKLINQTLIDIRDSKAFQNNKIIYIENPLGKPGGFQHHRKTSERIKCCAKIYSDLYKCTEMANETFGTFLAITLFLPITYIILNMFYLMEATSSGLFHDWTRYLLFLVYIGWGVVYQSGVIYLNVYFSECTVSEVSFILLLSSAQIIWQLGNHRFGVFKT